MLTRVYKGNIVYKQNSTNLHIKRKLRTFLKVTIAYKYAFINYCLFYFIFVAARGRWEEEFCYFNFFSHNYSASLETHYVCVCLWIHIDRFNIAN